LSDGGRRLAAIMFTDMVGYTALGQKNEPLSLALLEEQRKLIRPILARHNGREVKTIGDAFLVEFPNALDAIRCAYDIQRATREFNISLPAEERIHLRVGLHLGDAVVSGGDLSGDAVNVASRIESLAEDGGVCLTRQVYDQVKGKFDLPLTSLGPKTLKNVSEPLEVYKLEMPWEKATPQTEPIQLSHTRLAVLPFANFSPDPNDEYFADGMTEEIISTVSGISGLNVISRTSVMRYKGTTKTVEEIGKELRVGSILEGSFRKAGNSIRVTTQLIDVAGDKHLWTQNYDRELDNVFAVQSDIAKQVADALRVRIQSREMERIKRRPTESTEAYALYLKGKQLWNKRSEAAVRKAIEYFTLAIDLDPKFALAYVGLADSYSVLSNHGYMDKTEAAKKGNPATVAALRLDMELAEAHAARGWELLDYDWDWDAAETEFKRAIELNGSLAIAHQWYSSLLQTQGRLEEALDEARKALELDPLSPMASFNVAAMLYYSKSYDEAIIYAERSLEAEPNFVPGLMGLALAYSMKGDSATALSWSDKWAELVPTTLGMAIKALLYARAGERDKALKHLDSILNAPDLLTRGILVQVADAYALVGDVDSMFEWLEKALESRDGGVTSLKVEPDFMQYHSHPRFASILRQARLAT